MSSRQTQKIGQILVRGTNWIGDAVMSTPALQRLRASFPAARISLLTTPLTCELLADRGLVDEVIPYYRQRDGWRALWQTLPVLRRGGFDLAILFQNAFEAALLTRLAGIPHRIGFAAQGRSHLLTCRLRRGPEYRNRHQIGDYLDLVAASERLFLDSDFQPVEESPLPKLICRDTEQVAGDRLITARGLSVKDSPLVALNVGATNSRAKCWPADHYGSLARQLGASVGAKILLIGGPGEVESANAVAQAANTPDLINLAGLTSLGELLGILNRCALVISNDTGPAHIAAALGRPTLTLFGPTNEFETSPTGPRAALIRAPEIDCARCMYRDCPIDHRCMTRLSVETVYNRALAMMID
jgi:heptosyltransferase II